MRRIFANWLAAICHVIPSVTRAVVVATVPEKQGLELIASWPQSESEFSDLQTLAEQNLSGRQDLGVENRGARKVTGEPLETITYPLGNVAGRQLALAIEYLGRSSAMSKAVQLQLDGAAAVLEPVYDSLTDAANKPLITTMQLVASCLEHERYLSAATEAMTELANLFSCDRVSFGRLQDSLVQVDAVSHSARFDHRANVIREIGECMHEAAVQNTILSYPCPNGVPFIIRCHDELAEKHHVQSIVTIPFGIKKIAGAITFERKNGPQFEQKTIERLQQIVTLVGPLLTIRHSDEQPFWATLKKQTLRWLKDILGPRHLTAKVLVGCAVLGLLLSSIIQGEYNIAADARLEAKTQRVVVSSQDGYIAHAEVRPGDVVQKGEVLGALDDKDLLLQRKKWTSQLEQLQTEYRDALAKHDRSTISITNAKILQAEAQVQLIDEQLIRTRFVAPFDGLIVSGDLSQALGSPVERGQILFTVAPLDSYRIILQVDERDIGHVTGDQQGILVLSGMPERPLPFSVQKITPVSIAEEGRNYFSVEAAVDENSDLLRPGMEGVAKIKAGEKKLLWIWGHGIWNWLRIRFWSLF